MQRVIVDRAEVLNLAPNLVNLVRRQGTLEVSWVRSFHAGIIAPIPGRAVSGRGAAALAVDRLAMDFHRHMDRRSVLLVGNADRLQRRVGTFAAVLHGLELEPAAVAMRIWWALIGRHWGCSLAILIRMSLICRRQPGSRPCATLVAWARDGSQPRGPNPSL